MCGAPTPLLHEALVSPAEGTLAAACSGGAVLQELPLAERSCFTQHKAPPLVPPCGPLGIVSVTCHSGRKRWAPLPILG